MSYIEKRLAETNATIKRCMEEGVRAPESVKKKSLELMKNKCIIEK